MDLSKRVVYDAEFPVTILDKQDSDIKKPVVFYVKSLQGRDIQKIERIGRNKILAAKASSSDEISPEMFDLMEKTERDKVMNAVVRWEWNGNSFGDLGVDPEFTPENVASVLDHENATWIVERLFLGAANIANFTNK